MAGWFGTVMLLMAAGAGGEEARKPSAPEVLVLVSAVSKGVDQVAVSYARPVPEKQARAELRALIRSAGWAAGPVAVETRKPGQDGPEGTDSSTEAYSVVPYPEGALPVAPLVETYKAYGSLALIFQVQRPFRFAGPLSFEDRHVSIRLQQSPGLYRYDVSIKDPGFVHLRLPAVSAPAPPAGGQGKRRKDVPVVLVWMLALGISASAGLAVYLFASSRAAHAPGEGAKRRQ